jgi:C4-dicarboxylate-specific signal transduction histidine kinase
LSGGTSRRRSRSPGSNLQRIEVLDFQSPDLERIHPAMTEDTGMGLDPTHQGRVFDAFFTTKADGMVMGLSICNSIVRAHGGRLSAAAGALYGAVFRFTLPAIGEAAE